MIWNKNQNRLKTKNTSSKIAEPNSEHLFEDREVSWLSITVILVTTLTLRVYMFKNAHPEAAHVGKPW